MVSFNNSTSGAEAHLPFGRQRPARATGIAPVPDVVGSWTSSPSWTVDVNWDYAGKLQKAADGRRGTSPADLDFRLGG